MTEVERISKNLEKCVDSINEKGVQPERLSLTLISQSLVSIAEELAIMNDRESEQPTVDLSAKLERITSRYEEERNILLNSNLEYTPNNVLDIIDYILKGD